MSNYAILSIKQFKDMQIVGKAYEHNYRKGEGPINAEGEKSYLNTELVDRDENISFVDEIREITKREGLEIPRRKNSTVTVEVVLSFSEVTEGLDVQSWAKDSLAYLEKEFGKQYVVSAMLHLDEQTPHIHAIVIPVKDGKIDAPGLFNTRDFYTGKSKGYAAYQDSYAEAMAKHGLERGVQGTRIHHEGIKKFYGKLADATNISLPKPNKDEKIEDYVTRMEDEVGKITAPLFAQSERLKNELARKVAIISHKEEEIAAKNEEIEELKKKIPTEKDQSRLEYFNQIRRAVNSDAMEKEKGDRLLIAMNEAAEIGKGLTERENAE